MLPVITKVCALEQLANFTFDCGLHNFRPPEEQFKALKSLLADQTGFIFIALEHKKIVGYAAFQQPELYSYYCSNRVLELGAIEISKEYRNRGLGKKIFLTIKEDDVLESYIAIATEYFWHWDLKNTKLTVWEYKRLLEKLFSLGGFYPVNTDDPDILAHPANLLMVKYGKEVQVEDIAAFDQKRLKNCWMF